MMVVVPAFAVADDADEEIVPAIVLRLIVPVAPDVCHRIDRPSDVPHKHRPHEDAPDQATQAHLKSAEPTFGGHGADDRADHREDQPLGELYPPEVPRPFHLLVEPVAEQITRVAIVGVDAPQVGIVDQKPSHVAPEEARLGTMRIFRII